MSLVGLSQNATHKHLMQSETKYFLNTFFANDVEAKNILILMQLLCRFTGLNFFFIIERSINKVVFNIFPVCKKQKHKKELFYHKSTMYQLKALDTFFTSSQDNQ